MKSGLFSFCLFHSSVDTKLIAALFLEGLNMEKLNSKWRAKRSSSCRSQKWKRAQGNYRSLRLWFFFRLPKKETEECMIRTLQCIHQCSQNEMLFCLSLSPQSSTRLLWMGYVIFKYPDTWKKKMKCFFWKQECANVPSWNTVNTQICLTFMLQKFHSCNKSLKYSKS